VAEVADNKKIQTVFVKSYNTR